MIVVKWAAVCVRGQYYFSETELKNTFIPLQRFHINDVFNIEKINAYMGDEFVEDGEAVTSEKIEALLDEIEKREGI